jgi:hypothetical protein
VVEDLPLQLPQLWSRLEPELARDPLSTGLEGGESLALATGAVESEHQLGKKPLAERMLLHERLQLRYELCTSPEGKLRLDPLFDRHPPTLLETHRLCPRERLVQQIGERGPTPQRQRRVQCRCGIRDSSPRRRLTPLLEQTLESIEVQLLRFDPQQIARGTPREPAPSERLPKSRDVVVKRVSSARRRMLSPQSLDQPISGDCLVGVQQKDREQRTLLRPSERKLSATLPDADRTQNRELHTAT